MTDTPSRRRLLLNAAGLLAIPALAVAVARTAQAVPLRPTADPRPALDEAQAVEEVQSGRRRRSRRRRTRRAG